MFCLVLHRKIKGERSSFILTLDFFYVNNHNIFLNKACLCCLFALLFLYLVAFNLSKSHLLLQVSRWKIYTFIDVLNKWLNSKKNLKEQSKYNYQLLIVNHLTEIGKIKLNNLKFQDFQELFNNLFIKKVAISTQKK